MQIGRISASPAMGDTQLLVDGDTHRVEDIEDAIEHTWRRLAQRYTV